MTIKVSSSDAGKRRRAALRRKLTRDTRMVGSKHRSPESTPSIRPIRPLQAPRALVSTRLETDTIATARRGGGHVCTIYATNLQSSFSFSVIFSTTTFDQRQRIYTRPLGIDFASVRAHHTALDLRGTVLMAAIDFLPNFTPRGRMALWKETEPFSQRPQLLPCLAAVEACHASPSSQRHPILLSHLARSLTMILSHAASEAVRRTPSRTESVVSRCALLKNTRVSHLLPELRRGRKQDVLSALHHTNTVTTS